MWLAATILDWIFNNRRECTAMITDTSKWVDVIVGVYGNSLLIASDFTIEVISGMGVVGAGVRDLREEEMV